MRIQLQAGRNRLLFFDRFDDEARRFEDALRGAPAPAGPIPWPAISFQQGYRHLQSLRGRFFVLQAAIGETGRREQIAVVENESRLPFFRSGLIPYWIPRAEPAELRDQAGLLQTLRALCLRHTPLMSLQAHLYYPDAAVLDAAERLLREAGFADCPRTAPARTRILDLRPPVADVLAELPSKIRTKLKVKKTEEVRVEPLSRRSQIPDLRRALDDSFQRSAEGRFAYDFESLFELLEKSPEAAAAFGLFLSEDWDSPKAFIAGTASPPLFEYTVAGSRSHARLRQLPFNYILLWRLIEAAKALGASTFDMGGITDGGPDDPLAGISDFKRRFPGVDVDVGRELSVELRPARRRLFSFLRRLKGAAGK